MSERPRPIEITDPVEITVDGRTITAQRGELVIDACERNDAYIPRFCYHPRMNPVGMCRMCLVEIDSGRGPALQPSCMINVAPDMSVTTDSPAVAKAQDGVLEFLLANHPLDCPVCDKGGECPLQDQTMAYGPGESRWVEEKRHFEKPIPISETVYLDRERCILCDRCTRFASEVADDPLIHFINRGSNTEVNTFPGEPFSSYFSGNTVQICPVGALTAKPYRFRARPWDLQEVESTCTDCSVGCRITIDTSRNQVLRYRGVDSDPVNWSWLCDKGRFGFEAVNSEDRLTEPLVRGESKELAPARWSAALDAAARALRSALDRSGPGGVAVLGGARLTNESAYAWAKLAKGVIGTDHVDAQLGDGLPPSVLDLPGATIDEACRAGGTVLYLGPDPKEELPVLFLRLKHAVVEDGARIIEVTPAATGLTPYAAASLRPRPGELAAVVAALLGDLPADGAGGVSAEDLAAAHGLLQDVDAPVVVVGRANLAESPATVVDAAGVVHAARPAATFLPVLRRANVRGALAAGLTPGRLPGGVELEAGRAAWSEVWPALPEAPGLDADGILDAAANGRIDTLVLLGADPLRDHADTALARRALAGARTIIALDQFRSPSVDQADVVLPVAGFAEVDGTTTNLEGRVSVLHAAVTPPGTARADWLVAAELSHRLGVDLGVESSATELWDELTANAPVLAAASSAVLSSDDHADGVLTDLAAGSFSAPDPVQAPANNAYSSRLVVNRTLYDGGELLAHRPSSSGLVGGGALRLSPADAAPLGVSDGDRVTVTSQHGSVTAPVTVDAGVPKGTVVARHALDPDVSSLLAAGEVVCDVRVEVA